jgi:hypothetical protein
MLSTLITTALMVVLYVTLVRLVDMNEKEPLWAMLLFFALGGVLSFALAKLSPPALSLHALPKAGAEELARFMAMGGGLAVLVWHGQRKGYQEFNGTLDGVVYGATVGLGFATAQRLSGNMIGVAIAGPGMEPGMFDGFGVALVEGLRCGVFGAIVGAGLGGASEARSPALRAILPVVGLILAVSANAAHAWLGEGGALSEAGQMRSRIALGLPAVAIVTVIAYALRREGKTIRTQLADEAQTGAVAPDELALLSSALKREASYLGAMFGFRWKELAAKKTLHNRQVQLAFTKEKLVGETDPEKRADAEGEVSTLRAAIAEARQALQPVAAGPVGGAS